MKTLKKIVFIIIIALTGMALVTSCSKESQKGANKAGKGKKAAVVKNKPVILSPQDGKNTLNAVRTGQYVNLSWNIQPTGGKFEKINILRNATGTGKKRELVGVVDPNETNFKDCLPDENAYWYWVRGVDRNDKHSDIGPARVDADKQGAAHYIKPADNYKVVITRTDEAATIRWEFPEGEYQLIQIARYPMFVSTTFMEKKNIRLQTLAVKSRFSDALPDANSDYWYWFRIILKTGAVIDKGPIKAEYKN